MPRKPKLTPQMSARIAYMRFGLGPKGSTGVTLAMTPNAARDALLAEIANPNVIMPDPMLRDVQGVTEPVALTAARCGSFGTQITPGVTPAASSITGTERAERYVRYLQPDIGFAERMVLFWNNHFSLYPKGFLGATTVGLMERAVIRPNVFGNFYDMLKGVVQHPAMLVYLDNTSNIGPNSKSGRRFKATYNENLAREIMELHTVGVGAGYTPQDVTNFAKILTGWTVGNGRSTRPGQFVFDADSHEEAPMALMGQTFAQPGQEKGLAALRMLADHPSTAQHIAFKLLRHFVTERPTPKMVKGLASVFKRTGGNLGAVSSALVKMPYAWTAPMNRTRPTLLWNIAVWRAMSVTDDQIRSRAWAMDVGLGFLGHVLWGRLTPDGYQEENFLWENPDLLRCMTDAARMAGESIGAKKWTQRPLDLANKLFPGTLSPAAVTAISAQKDDRYALAMLFMTPEFLRR